MESKTTKSPHPTGESRGQIDTMNQHGKPEDAQARGTLTTPYRIDDASIMKKLDQRVCGQMNACSPEKQQRGCAYCADIVDDVLETYFRLKTEEINIKLTQTTPRYMIMLPDKVGDIPSYACCGSYGWSLWHDKKFATSWEYERDAVEVQKRAPNKIKYDGVVIDV